MAIVRRVLDLSHHNTVNDLDAVKAAGIFGIIHKATEGTGYKDDKYPGRKKGFLDIGLLWGAYHFFHPGNVKAQVDYFLRYAGIDDQTLYALDWEAASTGTASESDAQQFLEYLEQATGRKGVVYSGNVAKEKIHGDNKYLGSHRLWLAQYSSTCQTQESWHGNVWLWQYSDGINGPQPHGCPGVTGEVDTNSWTGTQEELRAEWSGYEDVPPIPEPEPPDDEAARVDITVAVTGNASVYVNGTLISSGTSPEPDDELAPNRCNITTTVFGGAADNEHGAYGGEYLNDTDLYVALPANIPDAAVRERGVRVWNRATGKEAVGAIRDKGPWMVDDNDYINTRNARPVAETCYKNKTPLPRGPNAGRVPSNPAGLDISPALAAAIGIDGLGKVDWDFV